MLARTYFLLIFLFFTSATTLAATPSVSEGDQALPGAFLPKSLKKAEAALASNNPQEAHDLVTKSLKRIEERYFDRAYFILGQSAYELGDFDEAFKNLQRSLKYRARNSDALHYLALLFKKNNDYDRALLTCKEALWFNDYIKVTPASSYSELSSLYLLKNEPEQAQEYLQLALKQSPEDPTAALSLASYYRQNGQFTEAAQTMRPFLKSKKLDPQRRADLTMEYAHIVLRAPHGTFERAHITSARDMLLTATAAETDSEEAEEEQEAVTIDPYMQQKLLASAYIQLSDFDAARKSLEAAKGLSRGADAELDEIEKQYRVIREANGDEIEE